MTRLLAEASDVIVGDIQEGATTAGVTMVMVRVVNVYQGHARPGEVLSLTHEPAWQRNRRAVIAMDRAIFFLERAGEKIRILPAMSGKAGFEQTYYWIPPGTRPREYQSSSADPLTRILADLAWSSEVGHPFNRGAAILLDWLFQTFRRQFPAQAYSRLSASTNPRVRSVGIAGLLSVSDIRGLVLLQTDENLAAYHRSFVLDELKNHYQNKNPKGISLLGKLATDEKRGLDLRIAASNALARMHTAATLPFLATLLDSDDIVLKTLAVVGLAQFANHEHRTSTSVEISMNTGYYVNYWKNWLKSREYY